MQKQGGSKSPYAKSQIVIYSALSGDIDDPRDDEILCFQGDKCYDQFKTGRMNAKNHKVLSHLWVDADISIWVDANIFPKVDVLTLVDRFLKDDADMGLWKHHGTSCLYQEAANCMTTFKKDKWYVDVTEEQVARYKKEGFPANWGLGECNVIVRKHNDKIKKFNNEWWSEICRYGYRDQCSFMYVLWKNPGVKVNFIPGDPRHHDWFKYIYHKNDC